MDSHPPKNPYGTVAESEFHSHSSLASQEEPEDKNLRLLAQIGEFEIYIYIYTFNPSRYLLLGVSPISGVQCLERQQFPALSQTFFD